MQVTLNPSTCPRMLGYNLGVPETGSAYGVAEPNEEFGLTDINCNGNELSLSDCLARNRGTCGRGEVASVTCYQRTFQRTAKVLVYVCMYVCMYVCVCTCVALHATKELQTAIRTATWTEPTSSIRKLRNVSAGKALLGTPARSARMDTRTFHIVATQQEL